MGRSSPMLFSLSHLSPSPPLTRQVSWHPNQRCGDERGPLPPIRESILRTIQGRISSIGLVAALHTSTRTEKALLHVRPLSNTWSRQNQSMRRGRSVASLLSTQIAAVKANTAKKSSQASRRQLPIHGFAPAASVPNNPIESPIPSRLPWQHNRIQSIRSDSIAIVNCNLRLPH